MQYLLIVVILLVLCAVGFSARKNASDNMPADVRPAESVTVLATRSLSRKDIQKQLSVIAKSPPPKELAMGAMCYMVAGPPSRIDYVCPACGEKTLYAVDDSADEKTQRQQWETSWKLGDLEAIRRLTQQIKKLDVALDESRFCSHCSTDVKTPRMGLVVTYPNQPEPHRVWDVTQADLLMLKAATEGKLKFKDLQDMEIALKDKLARLEKLLGVKAIAPRDQYLSRQDIQKQLSVIAKSPPPKELAMGAMCYEAGGSPSRIDYVCPACGEKTLYAVDDSADKKTQQRQWETSWKLGDLEALRRLTQQIKKLDVALDESRFCSHCSRNVKTPRLGLVVTYPNQPEPHRVWDVTQTDLLMLKAATEGKLKFKDLQDMEIALKDKLARLEKLLGVKRNDTD